MDDTKRNRKKVKTNVWISIGVAVLIILLILWLTIADLWGDTDVSANLIVPKSHLIKWLWV